MPSIMPDRPRRTAAIYLREWIDHRHSTGEKLAKDLGTSKSVVSKLSTGSQRYNQDWLEMIAFALECNVVDLFRHPTECNIDKEIRELNPKQIDILLRFIDFMKDSSKEWER